jgi:hypothetical protein
MLLRVLVLYALVINRSENRHSPGLLSPLRRAQFSAHILVDLPIRTLTRLAAVVYLTTWTPSHPQTKRQALGADAIVGALDGNGIE